MKRTAQYRLGITLLVSVIMMLTIQLWRVHSTESRMLEEYREQKREIGRLAEIIQMKTPEKDHQRRSTNKITEVPKGENKTNDWAKLEKELDRELLKEKILEETRKQEDPDQEVDQQGKDNQPQEQTDQEQTEKQGQNEEQQLQEETNQGPNEQKGNQDNQEQEGQLQTQTEPQAQEQVQPNEQQPNEQQQDEQQPNEQQPNEQQQDEQQPHEQQPNEQQPNEQQSNELRAHEQQPHEQQWNEQPHVQPNEQQSNKQQQFENQPRKIGEIQNWLENLPEKEPPQNPEIVNSMLPNDSRQEVGRTQHEGVTEGPAMREPTMREPVSRESFMGEPVTRESLLRELALRELALRELALRESALREPGTTEAASISQALGLRNTEERNEETMQSALFKSEKLQVTDSLSSLVAKIQEMDPKMKEKFLTEIVTKLAAEGALEDETPPLKGDEDAESFSPKEDLPIGGFSSKTRKRRKLT